MAMYQAPLRDYQFNIFELLGDELSPAFGDNSGWDRETVSAVLEGAGEFSRDILLPLNRIGDSQGCAWEQGNVRTPAGFKSAYEQFAANDWPGMCAEIEHGGQGMPTLLGSLVQETVCSGNLAWGIYVGLTYGAYLAIKEHGNDAVKSEYLPKLATGEWTGTMCLTEPQAGTDLGLLRTRAVPREDGSFTIDGTKIFISGGEHDLTPNIVHLVLARLPDAPAGTKGLSMFLVPKLWPGGTLNGVSCGSIEHKMGIGGSSTCVMNFDGARGLLVGELHGGMRAMFTMMNTARLAVGMQGVGIGEIAYQRAVAYARERRQGKALRSDSRTGQAADPLVVHADVRRMLLTQRAYVEGTRALACWISNELDRARTSDPDPAATSSDELVSLLTPVFKAFATDMGFEVANLGLQVFGGHGYISEHGVEQYVRDVRVTQLYEGANGIQALDLVGRQLPAGFGRHLRRFFHPVATYLDAHRKDDALVSFVTPVSRAFARLQQATAWIARHGMSDPNEAGAAAVDYLRLFGLTALGYLWTRAAQRALPHLEGTESSFYRAKVDTASFYVQRILPQTEALFAAITAGAESMMSFDELAF